MSEREELERSITVLEAQRPILGDAVIDPAIAALRDKLAALQPPVMVDQRKQVTVLFADVSGFTAMSETMDAEDVHDTMNALWTRMDGAIISKGGLIDKHIGDCVMALFGAPTAREDDPERAIRAALAMQDELTAFREERQAKLTMRIGINTGPVLLGEVGTTAEYTAMGDTVNLASRLEHAAPVGGVLISHDTYRHVRGVFDVRGLEPISVKGKAEPIQVYVVESARPRPFRVPTRGVQGIETRMIGREAELGQLQEALRATSECKEAHIVTVVGEAGVGKSRLLYEFRNWLILQPEEVMIFRGRATEEMINLPYSLIRDLFSFRFEIHDSDPAAVAQEKLEQGIVALLGPSEANPVEKAHFVGQLIGFDFSKSPHLRGIIGDAQQIRDRAFHYTVQLFGAATRDNPVAIYLEDIHWADDGSLDLIDHLAQDCRTLPLFVVALTRPDLFERRPAWGNPSTSLGQDGQATRTCLRLHPLSKQDSRHLVKEILQKVEHVPPDLQDLIVTGAEGNPFYVEELIKMLVEDGVIVKGGSQWQVAVERLAKVRVPPTLTGVLQARLDQLPLIERETLQRASVIGRIFWDNAVVQIYESEDGRPDGNRTTAALQAAHARELAFPHETSAFAGTQEYIFKHAILRDVIYESVLKRLRPKYHAQVAAWLVERSGERAGEYAGLIGEHYERGKEDTQAAKWYGKAGKQAQDTFALETALDYYQKALALEDRWEWHKGRVEVLHILGQRDEEQAELRAFESSSQAPIFEAAYLRGQYHESIGEYPEAQTAVEQALMAAQDQGNMVGEARSLAQLGLIARRRGDYEEAKDWYNQSLVLLQEQEAHSDEGMQALAQVLNGLGTIHRLAGEFDQAKVCYERSLVLNRNTANQRGEAEVLNSLGVTAHDQRHFGESLDYHRQALDIRRAIGDRAGEGTSVYNCALALREAGDYGQSHQYLQEALAIQQAIGNRWEEINVWNGLGILYQELGDLPASRECLHKGLDIAQDIGDEAGQAYLLSNLGLVMRDQGNLTEAEQVLTGGLTIVQESNHQYGMSVFLSYLSTVSLQAKRFETATEQAQATLKLRQELGLRLNTADDLATLAAIHMAVGDMTRASSYAEQALTILDECGGNGPEFPQRDYFICYQVLTGIQHPDRAQAALRSAYDLVVSRADRIIDPALRQAFLERVKVNREIVQEYKSVMLDV